MKKDIHPKYYDKVKAKCVCSAEFRVGSTLEEIEVEICSQCHPFYTGSEKIIDRGGRVEKFKQRRAAALEAKAKSRRKVGIPTRLDEAPAKRAETSGKTTTLREPEGSSEPRMAKSKTTTKKPQIKKSIEDFIKKAA